MSTYTNWWHYRYKAFGTYHFQCYRLRLVRLGPNFSQSICWRVLWIGRVRKHKNWSKSETEQAPIPTLQQMFCFKVAKTMTDLSSKMDLVDQLAADVSENRADMKSMNSAFEAMSRLENNQEEIQNTILDLTQQINALAHDSQTSRSRIWILGAEDDNF